MGETERCEADAEGPAPYDRIAVWAPASRDHEGWHQDSVVSYQLSLNGGTPMTLSDAVRRWVDTDEVKGVVMEVDSGVDPSASNVALGLPEATSGPCWHRPTDSTGLICWPA